MDVVVCTQFVLIDNFIEFVTVFKTAKFLEYFSLISA